MNNIKQNRRHSITYRRAQKAWRAVAYVAELAEASPLDQRTHAAAIATIAERFGQEVMSACEVEPAKNLSDVSTLTDDQLDKLVRATIGEARRRFRAGQDKDGYLAGVLEAVESLPKINTTQEPTP